MIKKLTCYLAFVFMSLGSCVFGMDDVGASGTPSQVSSAQSNAPAPNEVNSLMQWFVDTNQNNYQGHFHNTYYQINICSCPHCPRYDSSTANTTKYFVVGLRKGDSDVSSVHKEKQSKELMGDQINLFSIQKEWQYLKDDMINCCLDPSVKNMLQFTGLPFIKIVVNEQISDVLTHLKSATTETVCIETPPLKNLPAEWGFNFSNMEWPKKGKKYDLFQIISHYKKLKEVGSYADPFMVSAIAELKLLSEGIDQGTDLAECNKLFFKHLMEFRYHIHRRSKLSETHDIGEKFIVQACELYKGLMSRNPLKAFEYRAQIEMPKFRNEKEDTLAKESFSHITLQLDKGKVDFSQFFGDNGKVHVTTELNRLKSAFNARLQGHYDLIYTLRQYMMD